MLSARCSGSLESAASFAWAEDTSRALRVFSFERTLDWAGIEIGAQVRLRVGVGVEIGGD